MSTDILLWPLSEFLPTPEKISPIAPTLPAPTPVVTSPSVTKAKDDLKARLQKARSRAQSDRTTGFLLAPLESKRPVLSDTLG